MLSLLLAVAVQGDEAAHRVERAASPSVVRVRNAEGAGTGFLIDAAGLVLTNAHVACSPLPYGVHVEFGAVWKEFRKVTLAGVHRTRDLALLRIDPAEHGLPLPALRLRSDPPSSGEPVYALGFPGDYESGTRRLTTIGALKALRTLRHGQPHLETDATAWYGNSGGPLCDARGEVIGVVTLKEPSNHRALAVPVLGMAQADFVPLRERPRDAAGAGELLRTAEAALNRSRGPEGAPYADYALLLFRMAATLDAGNAELHARIGALEAGRRRPGPAAAYLVRSLQISPWPEDGAAAYRTLSECLLETGKAAEARAAATEGFLKYPAEVGPFLRLAAQAEARLGRRPEAYRSAGLALDRGAPTGMSALRSEAGNAMTPKERDAARTLDEDGPGWLDALVRSAEDARRERRPAIDAGFGRLLSDFDGVQAAAAPAAGAAPPQAPAPTAAPDAGRYTDDEVTTLFLKAQLQAARSLAKSGRAAAAAEILESILKEHPARPEAREARELLDRPGGR